MLIANIYSVYILWKIGFIASCHFKQKPGSIIHLADKVII